MRKEFLIAFILIIPIAAAQDLSSTDYKIISMEFNSGGHYLNSTKYQLFTNMGTVGTAKMENTFICLGYLCFSLEQLSLRTTVSFLLNLNASSMTNAVTTGIGYYTPADITKFFACVEDAGIASKPSLGIVFSGRELKYIEVQNITNSYIMKVSQLQEDNGFLIPVTSGGCSVIGNRLPMFSLTPMAFREEVVDAVELFLSYPFTDIVGNFERTGKTTLIMEKNNTNQIVVDVI